MMQAFLSRIPNVIQAQSSCFLIQNFQSNAAVELYPFLANAPQSITLQVGHTQVVLKPSGINVVATVIHLNPSSSGSATPASLDAKVIDANTQKTQTQGALQDDVFTSDAPEPPSNNNLKNKLEIGALAASMVAAIPFDSFGAGEVEQGAAGAEIASLEEGGALEEASQESTWIDSAGNIKWPLNEGFQGDPENITLNPGDVIDRYGDDFGRYVSPEGTPYEARSLAPGTDDLPYSKFEVKKPIFVKSGKVSPWFDEPGGGIQHKLSKSIQELLEDGSLERK